MSVPLEPGLGKRCSVPRETASVFQTDWPRGGAVEVLRFPFFICPCTSGGTVI